MSVYSSLNLTSKSQANVPLISSLVNRQLWYTWNAPVQSAELRLMSAGAPACKEGAYLPRATTDVTVSEEHCQNCSHGIVHKLDLK